MSTFERLVIDGFAGNYYSSHQKRLDAQRKISAKTRKDYYKKVCKIRGITLNPVTTKWVVEAEGKGYKGYIMFTLTEAVKYSNEERMDIFKLAHEMKVVDLHDQVNKITFKTLMETG